MLPGIGNAELPAAQSEDSADYFARDTFRIDMLVCPLKGSIEYEPGEIECGLLQVPENRGNPDSRFALSGACGLCPGVS